MTDLLSAIHSFPHRTTSVQLLIEYEQSRGVVRQVYDDIRATRKTDDINNFWKGLANHPPTLQRIGPQSTR